MEDDLIIGSILVEIFKDEQKEFDSTVKPLTEFQEKIARDLQKFAYEKFDGMIDHKSIPEGMEEVQLRLHAPSKECAMLQALDFICKNFGFLPHRGPSSGVLEILPNRLYFIVMWLKSLNIEEFNTNLCSGGK